MTTTARAALRREVSDALGDRQLIWSGIRGDDAESLSDLPQFAASFTIINAYRRRPLRDSLAYEELSGTRVDMETWDVDDHPDAPATVAFRRALLTAMAPRSALLPYRPSRFLSALSFARRGTCLNLGLFGSHQFAFEHKPWVETAVAAMGIPNLEWRYIADEEQLDAERLLASGPVMLRRSRTSGGEGMLRVDDPAALASGWPRGAEAFVSVSRYVPAAVPINVGATVWDDGVTVHFPSVQLIGIESCVTRPFGYCGNDFAAAKDIEPAVLDDVEAATVRIGGWLRDHGYRGTFGVDYLVDGDRALFTEVNPRFQGSTRASARLSVELDQPCLLLEHISAVLGLRRPDRPPLRTAVRDAPDLAQVVVHRTAPTEAEVDVSDLRRDLRALDTSCRMDVAVEPHTRVQPGAVAARFSFDARVTTTGFDLRPDIDAAIGRFAGGRPADELPLLERRA